MVAVSLRGSRRVEGDTWIVVSTHRPSTHGRLCSMRTPPHALRWRVLTWTALGTQPPADDARPTSTPCEHATRVTPGTYTHAGTPGT